MLESIKGIGDFVESFMSGVLVRQFPCGPAHLDFSILGILNDAEGALQENRELLFSKYGYGISRWTMVSQIAAIPAEGGLVTELDPKNLDLADSTSVSRSNFESAAVNMMQMMEGLGFAAGPRYPSISVTPIAVFREIAT